MLVRITNKCMMACSHCLVNAIPDGGHMAIETFTQTIDLLQRLRIDLIMLSGGEPTDHPDFLKYVRFAKSCGFTTAILSNGMFLDNEKYREEILALGCLIQITNDPRYYPRRITRIEHPLISYETKLRTLVALGRSKENIGRKAPGSFNFRSLVRSIRSVSGAIATLRVHGKMCTPSINADGSVVAGESPECFKIGTVHSTETELLDNVLAMKHCNRCGLESILDPPYRRAIGLEGD